jgi:bifunctional DNA-binding transcriptional regulator/antitoxin component of YhaV-PrlF toxin-antitoxin module
MIEFPLIDKILKLEKFSGKGGWTFVRLPEIPPDKNTPFGWKKVKGKIDDFEINKFRLMPMGNGQLFLPVRAEIRKKIKKEEGDFVHVLLYADNTSFICPEEFLTCLRDDPDAWNHFQSLNDDEKEKHSNWIYETKSEDKRVERLAEVISKLARTYKKFKHT